jgi:hypothetical protein
MREVLNEPQPAAMSRKEMYSLDEDVSMITLAAILAKWSGILLTDL